MTRFSMLEFGNMTYKKVILRLPKILECLDPGALECWSIGVLKKKPSIL
jgi:hypothetical protein